MCPSSTNLLGYSLRPEHSSFALQATCNMSSPYDQSTFSSYGTICLREFSFLPCTSTKMFERSVGSNSILSFFEEPAAAGDLGTAFLGDSSPSYACLEVQAVFSSKIRSKNTREKKLDFRSYVVSHVPTMDLLIESSGIESGSVCSH